MDEQTKTQLEAQEEAHRLKYQGPVTMPLVKPVKWGSEEISELVLRPQVGAFDGFKIDVRADGGIVFEPHRFAQVGLALAGQPRGLLAKLTIEDMMALARHVQNFMAPSLETGDEPSPS